MRQFLLVIASAICCVAAGTAQDLGSELRAKAQSADWKVRADALARVLQHADWIHDDGLVRVVLDLTVAETETIMEHYRSGRGAEAALGSAYIQYCVYDLGEAQVRLLRERPTRSVVHIMARASFSNDTVFARLVAEAALRTDSTDIVNEVADAPWPDSRRRGKAANLAKLIFEAAESRSAGRPLSAPARQALVRELTTLASDPELHVRREAAKALGKSGDASVIPLLDAIARTPVNMVEDKQGSLQRAAREAAAALRAKTKP